MALYDSLAALLHSIVDRTRWIQESDRDAAHEAVDAYAKPLAVPAGVQEQAKAVDNENSATADSFPNSNPQE